MGKLPAQQLGYCSTSKSLGLIHSSDFLLMQECLLIGNSECSHMDLPPPCDSPLAQPWSLPASQK